MLLLSIEEKQHGVDRYCGPGNQEGAEGRFRRRNEAEPDVQDEYSVRPICNHLGCDWEELDNELSRGGGLLGERWFQVERNLIIYRPEGKDYEYQYRMVVDEPTKKKR